MSVRVSSKRGFACTRRSCMLTLLGRASCAYIYTYIYINKLIGPMGWWSVSSHFLNISLCDMFFITKGMTTSCRVPCNSYCRIEFSSDITDKEEASWWGCSYGCPACAHCCLVENLQIEHVLCAWSHTALLDESS